MKIRIGVFFGGRSVEHEVSVISAQQAMAALNPDRYEVVPVYLAKDGSWRVGPELRDIAAFRDLPDLLARTRRVMPSLTPGDHGLYPDPPRRWRCEAIHRLDLAMPVLHGTFGEDGCIQGVFEMMGLPYTGCDVSAAAIGMDKVVCKRLWKAAGLPVLPDVVFTESDWLDGESALLDRIETHLGFPVIVKPAQLGSSVGLNLAADRPALLRAIEDTSRYTQRMLVEPQVTPLREINCSLLGNAAACQASVCEEPLRSADLLSFQDKYEGGGKSQGMTSLKRQLPALIPDALRDRVQDLARAAFQAVGAAGVARVDFLYHEPDGQIYLNEINTLPGSLSFYLWEASGLPFPALLDRLVDLAFARHRDQARLTLTYDTNILASFGGAKGAKSSAPNGVSPASPPGTIP